MNFVFRPSAAIEIDGRRLTAAEAGLERLGVILALGAHGFATLDLWPDSKFADAAPGAPVKIAMGKNTTVMTGSVTSTSRRPGRVHIEALDATAPLGEARISAIFRDVTVADIVRSLTVEAGVATENVAGALKMEAYAVDVRRSLWRHLNDLATLVGADLAATADGRLRFALGGKTTARTLRFGADLIDWRADSGGDVSAPGFAPHGAASQRGSRLWHHLLPDPLGASPPWSRIAGALRSRDAADAAAGAAAVRAARARTPARAVTLGAPALRPGDIVEIAGLAGGGLSLPGIGDIGFGGAAAGERYRAVSVHHRIDAAAGFTTSLKLEGTGEDASLLGGLGALAGGLA